MKNTDFEHRPVFKWRKIDHKLRMKLTEEVDRRIASAWTPGAGALEFNNVCYAGACVVGVLAGLGEINEEHKKKPPVGDPEWLRRMDKKISEMRADISRLTSFVAPTANSAKLAQCAESIYWKYKWKRRDKPDWLLASLKR